MSKLYRRESSPYWYGKFQHAGKTHRFSTGKTDKGEARNELQRRIDEAHGEQHLDELVDEILAAVDVLPQERRDESLRGIVRRILRVKDNKLGLADAWEAWLNSPRSRNPGESTLDGYSAIWSRFRGWLKDNHPGLEFLHEVDAVTAEAYAAELWGSGVSPRTYNAHIGFLKAVFFILERRAGLEENVWADFPRMEGQTESRRMLTPEELTKIVEAATGSLRVMLLLGMYTGMRLGDACLLKWGNVDFSRGVIEYMPLKTRRKNKVVTVPMHKVLHAVLLGYRQQVGGELLLPDEADLYGRDAQGVSRKVNAHFRSCGITTTERPVAARRKRAVARAGFHSLRHSFVSLCAASGVPQVALMELVGHGSPAMTRLYSHVGNEQKAQAIARLPSLASTDQK